MNKVWIKPSLVKLDVKETYLTNVDRHEKDANFNGRKNTAS